MILNDDIMGVKSLIQTGVRFRFSIIIGYVNICSLSHFTALVPNAGTYHVYLICMFIRHNSCLLGKVKYCMCKLIVECCM